MKKFTKITLIIAAVLVVIGLGFIIAGSVTAGGAGVLREQLRSGDLNFGNWHFEDGVYYRGGVEVDVSDVVGDAMNLLPVGTEASKNEFAEEISHLEVDVDLANITIKNTDAAYAKVSLEEGYMKYYEAKVNGDTLHVNYDVSGHNFKQGPKIVIELPKDMQLESIYIDTDLGEVNLLEMKQSIDTLEINSDLGNIRIEDCKVTGNCTMNAALGNIVVEDSDFRRIDMNADMGNIDFSGKVEGDITAQADMGNIEVELDGKESDYNIELGSDMGDVKYKGQKQNGMGGSFTYYQENAIGDIVLNCDMGNVELEFD